MISAASLCPSSLSTPQHSPAPPRSTYFRIQWPIFINLVCVASFSAFKFNITVRDQLKCDGTRTETRFRHSAKRTSPFKSAGASVQSTTGSRGVRISCSNAGYTMFRGSVKVNGYPLHSPVSPSLPLPCVTVCHHISTRVYYRCGTPETAETGTILELLSLEQMWPPRRALGAFRRQLGQKPSFKKVKHFCLIRMLPISVHPTTVGQCVSYESAGCRKSSATPFMVSRVPVNHLNIRSCARFFCGEGVGHRVL